MIIITIRRLLPLPLLVALSAALTLATPAHAGPTASADLDLGTSVWTSSNFSPYTRPPPSPLYLVGFTLRAGWRFDLGPVWLLPEIGGGYGVERFESTEGITAGVGSPHVSRFFGGGRAGWSAVLRPELRFEPAIYGHAGVGFYGAQNDGSAFDVGLALDLRIRHHFIVGAQVAYDVVTIWSSNDSSTGGCAPPLNLGCPVSFPPVADPWVSYGVHAGWLFW